MTNEQILKERYKNIDKYLGEWLKNYKKINRKTRDELQSIFDSIKIPYSDLNKMLSKKEKDKLDRFILELKENGYLNGYFGYNARLILNKKNVSYLQMLELMITASYIKESELLKENNNDLFYKTCKDSYEKGIEDTNHKPRIFDMSILYIILNMPILNATAEEYLYSLSLTNANELYRQALIDMQLKKELDVDNRIYKDLFNKQQNRFLSINENKISGGIENIVENISNKAYLQAGIDTNTKECRFIAEMDKRTTDMCETLNNQVFKLNGMNIYSRYSDADKKNVIYHTKGLVIGENLPPINNHFHWCRSTISYNIDLNVANSIRNNIKIANNYDKEQFNRYKKYFGDEITDDVEEFAKMKYNNPDEWEYLKQNYQYAKHRYNAINENKLDKDISVHDYIRKVHEIRRELLDYKMYNGSKVKDISHHFYDRVIGNPGERRISVSLEDIKNTLSNVKNINYRKNGSIRIDGEKCQVSFNPKDLRLIQTTPRRYKK